MCAMKEKSNLDVRTLLALALVISLAPGCITEPDTLDNDASNTLLQIVSMQGQAGEAGGPGESVVDLFSDVCFAPPGEGCSIFNDNGVVTMRAISKDPAQFSSAINAVTIERYRVTYIRADGRNVPGVDVPYPFDGVANFLVSVDGEDVERGFVIVRHQAKAESPLRQIQADLTAILSTIAQVDFYGHDSAGRAVTVTGYLNVTFADFANATED
jgi:hypothetical protein